MLKTDNPSTKVDIDFVSINWSRVGNINKIN